MRLPVSGRCGRTWDDMVRVESMEVDIAQAIQSLVEITAPLPRSLWSLYQCISVKCTLLTTFCRNYFHNNDILVAQGALLCRFCRNHVHKYQ